MKIITKASLILITTLLISFLGLLSLYSLGDIDPSSDFYKYLQYLINPILISLVIIIYCFLNNHIFRIFDRGNYYPYLYLFFTTLFYQYISYSLGYGVAIAVVFLILICQGLSLFIQKKDSKIFIPNLITFIIIILTGLFINLPKNFGYISADFILINLLMSYAGIFHFFYILINYLNFEKN